MKSIFNIPQKFKTALLMMVIVITVLFTSIWGNTTVTELNKAFSSIYKDRLIPSYELFHITDLMYQKRLVITNDLSNKDKNLNIIEAVAHKNQQIDSIIQEYEKTQLVAEENIGLKNFKRKIQEYNREEQKILLSSINSPPRDQTKLISLFDELRKELINLSQIQTLVGSDLVKGSEQKKDNASLMHYCQIAIILVVMLFIQIIIFNARSVIPKKQQNFRLN